MQEENQSEQQDKMVQLQPSIVTKFCRQRLKDHVISSDFRKEFSKSLSLFIFYIQSFAPKKTLSRDDIISILQKKGMGAIAAKVSEMKIGEKTQEREKQKVNINEKMEREEPLVPSRPCQ